jgi:hypothetical protein
MKAGPLGRGYVSGGIDKLIARVRIPLLAKSARSGAPKDASFGGRSHQIITGLTVGKLQLIKG